MKFKRPEIVRPPSEWKSYFLPLTAGCSNNSCTFCGNYGSKLLIRDVFEVKKEIDAVAVYLSSNVSIAGIPRIVYDIASQWDGEKVFLQDSDALAYTFPELVEALEYLNRKLPSIRRIAAYATTQDILRRSVNEMKELHKLKLGMLYIGLESGDNVVLKHVEKGVLPNRKLKPCAASKLQVYSLLSQ